MAGNWKRWEIRRRERRCETENTGFLDVLEVRMTCSMPMSTLDAKYRGEGGVRVDVDSQVV